MSIQLIAHSLPATEKRPLEVALEVIKIREGSVIRIIVDCCAPHFEEIAATASAWITGREPIPQGRVFQEVLLQLSVPFATWLMSQREAEQTGQLQLCEGLFQRFARQQAQLRSISEVALDVVVHYKAHPVTQAPSARAFDLRVVLHQLFVIRQELVYQFTASSAQVELMRLHSLLPQQLRGLLEGSSQEEWDVLTPAAEQLVTENGTAELVAFFLKLAAAHQLIATFFDIQDYAEVKLKLRAFEESTFVSLKASMKEAISILPRRIQLSLAEHLSSTIERFHLFALSVKTLILSSAATQVHAEFWKHFSHLRSNPFLNALYPELGMLRSIAARGQPEFSYAQPEATIQRASLECQPYTRFQVYVQEREFAYAFLFALHQRLETNLSQTEALAYAQLLRKGPQLPLLTPEAFSGLIAGGEARSVEQLRAELNQIKTPYKFQLPKLSPEEVAASFAPSLKKQRPAPPKKQKHKNRLPHSVAIHGAAAAAGADAERAQADLEVLKDKDVKEKEPAAHGAAAAAGAGAAAARAPLQGLEAIFAQRTVDLKTFKVAPRVQARLNASKTKGAQREDTWAHGFTTQLDQFLGTSYCYSVTRSHPQTNQKETHYCFIVTAEDEEGPVLETTRRPASVPYLATYTVDKNGVCYHRCLQRKSLFELVNAQAGEQVFNLIEWPSLEQAAAQAKPRVEEPNNRPMQHSSASGIVTVFDKKHNVTFKVLPRS